MTGRVSDKVVVVTGAARGQGRVEVELLAGEGADVWATDVLDEEGAALADGWEGAGTVTYQHLDVASASDWNALRDAISARHGRVDGLVNNAGVPARERLPNVTLDQWDSVIAVNTTGPLLGIQTLFPLMVRGSSIVNIVSVAGLGGHAAAPYTVSKWALRGLTRTAAMEFGPLGIRVNAVFPGLIDTPLMSGASPHFRQAAIDSTPLGRIGLPEDIAPLIVYLLSDESSYVTGAEIAVDGGMTSHVSHKGIADAIKQPAG